LVIGVWIVVLVASVATSSVLLSGSLTNDVSFVNNPEAKRAALLVEDRLRGKQGTT